MNIGTHSIEVENAGFYVNRNTGKHVKRVIPSHELIFVRSGTLKMREANQTWHITPGQCLILEPDLEHEGIENYPPDMKFYWIHFVPKKASREQLDLPKLVTLQRPERMTEMFHRFVDDQESGNFPYPERKAQLMLMLLELLRHRDQEQTDHSRSLCIRAKEYIENNATKSISTIDIARSVGVNPDYLGRIFKRSESITLLQAVHREQMRHARQLLRDTHLNMEEIASASGFNDTSHFRRVFHSQQGICPRSYRKLYAR